MRYINLLQVQKNEFHKHVLLRYPPNLTSTNLTNLTERNVTWGEGPIGTWILEINDRAT